MINYTDLELQTGINEFEYNSLIAISNYYGIDQMDMKKSFSKLIENYNQAKLGNEKKMSLFWDLDMRSFNLFIEVINLINSKEGAIRKMSIAAEYFGVMSSKNILPLIILSFQEGEE